MTKVFVYGTLRKGEGNSSLLRNAKLIAEQCWTYGELYDTGYGYPAIAAETDSTSSRVFGELYEVSSAELILLDDLEDYEEGGSNNLYNRIEQTVFTDKGAVEAYVYVAAREELLKKKITSGDWKEYRLLRNVSQQIYYFAYGSCMDERRFFEHGVAELFQNVVGRGILENYSLKFTHQSRWDGLGRADIVEDGGRVEGKVYRIPVQVVKDYLYGREGAPHVYRPTFVEVELDGGDKVQALTFTVVDKKEETAPPTSYEEEILRGASGFLSEEYVSSLRNHFKELKKYKS